MSNQNSPKLLLQSDIADRLPEGKRLKHFTVMIMAIRESTGEQISINENAQIALNEVDGKLAIYRQLMECLNA